MKAIRPLSIDERITWEVAEKASAEYKKKQALRHFKPRTLPLPCVFDNTEFGQRGLLADMTATAVWSPDEQLAEEQEELYGVLDIRQ